ncbi:MAG: hypothetical protein J2P36_04500 [Ktedonobacteraceae bacterium]|nr:hypothetical protein [Ktedonobacteraceae bacterium]
MAKRPTQISLTEQGLAAIDRHWQLLDKLRKGAQSLDLSYQIRLNPDR